MANPYTLRRDMNGPGLDPSLNFEKTPVTFDGVAKSAPADYTLAEDDRAGTVSLPATATIRLSAEYPVGFGTILVGGGTAWTFVPAPGVRVSRDDAVSKDLTSSTTPLYASKTGPRHWHIGALPESFFKHLTRPL